VSDPNTRGLHEVFTALNKACATHGGQAALAKKTGFSQQYVNVVVTARREVPEAGALALGFRKVVSMLIRLTPTKHSGSR